MTVQASIVSVRQCRAPVLIAALGTLGATGMLTAAVVSIPASADSETRETLPEATRGSPAPAGNTQQSELTIANSPAGASNRNVDVLRFTLPAAIQTAADLENYAELRLYFRTPNITAGQTGALRVYGLNPSHPLNTSWSETNVIYRDAGDHQLMNIPQGTTTTAQALVTPSVISQPVLGTVAAAPPVAPLAAVAGYNANASDPRRVPGIRYENAPFSQQTATENSARLTYNQNQRAAYDADLADDGIVQGTYAYLPYFNQPGYNVTLAATLGGGSAISVGDGNPATTGDGIPNLYSDIPATNRPFYSGATQTWVDDVVAADTTYLGYTRFSVATTGNYEGSFVSLGTGFGLSSSTPTADSDAAMAALIAYLSSGLSVGFRDFTFLVGPGIGAIGGGNDPQNNITAQLASKEYTPVNVALGGQGALAPRLILAPEPGTITGLLGLAGVALRRRRTV